MKTEKKFRDLWTKLWTKHIKIKKVNIIMCLFILMVTLLAVMGEITIFAEVLICFVGACLITSMYFAGVNDHMNFQNSMEDLQDVDDYLK